MIGCTTDVMPGETNLFAVVRPRAELEAAILLIEREVGDVQSAADLERGWGTPADLPCVVQDGVCTVRRLVRPIGTAYIYEGHTLFLMKTLLKSVYIIIL